ncbi:MAG: 50S ribosomal protein L28 [Bacilli bacterium]|nr:50S ribosomal protein L28 [Bacilli bacterium]
MATKITSKKPLTGNKRSHALNATKKKQKPNLQKKTINGQKVIISAREAKTLNK